jgi:hypothetical protein
MTIALLVLATGNAVSAVKNGWMVHFSEEKPYASERLKMLFRKV